MPRLVIAVLTACVIGCGGSPTGPSPMPAPPAPIPAPTAASIAGTWTGQLLMTFNGQRFAVSTRTELIQHDRTITGAWFVRSVGNDINGEVMGTLDGIGVETYFSGTVTWDSSSEDSVRCVGRGRFSGMTAVLRWESDRFEFDNCSGAPTGLVWTMQPLSR